MDRSIQPISNPTGQPSLNSSPDPTVRPSQKTDVATNIETNDEADHRAIAESDLLPKPESDETSSAQSVYSSMQKRTPNI